MKFSLTKLGGFGMILSGIGKMILERSIEQESINLILTGIAIIGGRNALNKIVK